MSRASLISSNLILTPSLYASTITLYAPYGGSATITTTSGSFIDGTTSKTITGYLTVRSNALYSNTWTIQDIFPYSNDFADLESLTIRTIDIRSSVNVSYRMENSGYISTLGAISTTSFTQNGQPITILPNLTSTVNGLGNIYISSGSNFIASTIAGAGSSYISSKGIQSTVAGLGTTYVSTASLVSTVVGYSNYIGASNLISTVSGLSNLNYFMGISLQSTVIGLSNIYINSNQGISTITSLQSNEQVSIVSTVKTLSNYISSLTLQSTINGLGSLYLSTSKLNELTSNINLVILPLLETTVANLATTYPYISSYNLTSTVQGLTYNLSSNVNTLGYISSLSLQSTVAGLGPVYISSKSLQSTVAGLEGSGITSTVAGLGSSYLSTGIISSVTDLSNKYTGQLTTFYNGLGSNYISSPSLQSTVAGLGVLYISTASLTSTITSLNAVKSLTYFEDTLGSIYISRGGIISTVNGLGTTYISTASLQSSMAGSLTVYSNIIGSAVASTTAGLGQTYTSTTLAIINSPDLLSFVGNINTYGYSNVANVFSNGYVYYRDGYIVNTSNFYEEANTTICRLTISSIGTITASNIKTSGYGNNYLFGDGTYLTISSDRELKDSIEPMSSADALTKVLSLRGVYYNKIGDPHKYIGCIAQEVEEIFPEVVITHPSMNPVDLKSMKYDFLTAPLVESVKELISIHSTLKYFVQKKVREI